MVDGFDAVIVGGGLIGAACADALAGDGRRVCVLEAGPFMREASWAGAGILHPIHPWTYPTALHPLLREAVQEHQRCAADLQARTGWDLELERSGLIFMGADLDRLADWCGNLVEHRRVDAGAIEPALLRPGPGLLLPAACHVRNDRLGNALLEGARRRGATLRAFTRATALLPGRIETERGAIETRLTVVCAGAWSCELLPGLATEPVRGQMLLYEGGDCSLHHMIVFPGGEYAVPRRGGKILFGSTLERVGFDARPTRDACDRLARSAQALLGLAPDRLRAAWAGLRPGTRTSLPYLGWDPSRDDLLLACGHYRNGILLAPLTGRIIADLAAGRDPHVDLAPFGCTR